MASSLSRSTGVDAGARFDINPYCGTFVARVAVGGSGSAPTARRGASDDVDDDDDDDDDDDVDAVEAAVGSGGSCCANERYTALANLACTVGTRTVFCWLTK